MILFLSSFYLCLYIEMQELNHMSAEWQYEQICFPKYNYFFKGITLLLAKKLDISKHAGKKVNINK